MVINGELQKTIINKFENMLKSLFDSLRVNYNLFVKTRITLIKLWLRLLDNYHYIMELSLKKYLEYCLVAISSIYKITIKNDCALLNQISSYLVISKLF